MICCITAGGGEAVDRFSWLEESRRFGSAGSRRPRLLKEVYSGCREALGCLSLFFDFKSGDCMSLFVSVAESMPLWGVGDGAGFEDVGGGVSGKWIWWFMGEFVAGLCITEIVSSRVMYGSLVRRQTALLENM